jgi:hypothetical protein
VYLEKGGGVANNNYIAKFTFFGSDNYLIITRDIPFNIAFMFLHALVVIPETA